MGFRDMVLLVVSNTDKLLVIMDNLCFCGLRDATRLFCVCDVNNA